MSAATTEPREALTDDEAAPLVVDVIAADGTTAGTIELPANVFGVQVNIPLIHQVVVAQLAAARQGTSSTKSRGEVRGGGRKPYRQKGTGRARQGSTRAPQFAGGGVVHGPSPRSYAQRTPKKMKAAALRGALSDRARNGRLHVVAGLIDGDVPSTKAAVEILAAVSQRRHVLVVVQRSDELSWKSLRNAETVHVLVPDQLNTYDVLVSDDIVFTRSALEEFLAGPAKGRSATASARESEVDPAEPEVTSSPGETTEPTDGAPKTVTKKAPAKKAAKKTAEKAEKADKAEAGPAKKAAAKKAPAKKAAAKKTEPAADEAGTDGSDT
ncbi:MAG: large subunit ribosomal protein [Actinomycetota bacterium]|nr:large subunit ribosomal protein [Actinomycetota bacterium]